MPRPVEGEYGAFYKGYIELTTDDEVVALLEQSYDELAGWLAQLPEAKLQYAYAEGKWTIAQVLQHMIDTERVFAYRAMCIGRGEEQALPGFDENSYALAAPAAGRKLKGLTEELLTLRKATIILFRSLAKEDALHCSGLASGLPITVNALGFILEGHILHHRKVLEERYLGV